MISGHTLVLYDSHAESSLLQLGKKIVVAGVQTPGLVAYANLACLVEFAEEPEEDAAGGEGAPE